MDSILQTKIGIVGGGQLGKMMAQEAKKMGFTVAVLDPAADCPAHAVSDLHLVAGFNDAAAITELSNLCDVLTYEFEHINADALLDLVENKGKKVYPTPKSLKTIQDKFTQKSLMLQNGLPVPRFTAVASLADAAQAGKNFGYPFILKTRTGGYDGKGNHVITDPAGLEKGYEALGGGVIPLMAESFVSFDMEISVLACRGIGGETAIYPVGKNTHINNILDETLVPAPISAETAGLAMAVAKQVMEAFEGVGMFCVELFVLNNGQVLINEVAPRPHNSGHYSIEACVTSQFEQHIRAIAGLPLGDPSLIRPAAMRNLLGEEGYNGPAIVAGMEEALKIKGAKVHIYGKSQTSPRRKMGHITVTADSPEKAGVLCKKAQQHIKIIAK